MRIVFFSVGLLMTVALSSFSQIVINEVMCDPEAVPDSKGEWVELYNSSDSSINLAGWTLRDSGRDRHIIEPDSDLVVLPAGFVVLGRNADSTENGGYRTHYTYSNFLLSNDEDEVVIVDPSGGVIDSVAYGVGWPSLKGASMELVLPGFDNSDSTSWGLAESSFGLGDLGSPGYWNSISGTGIEPEQLQVDEAGPILSASPFPNPASGGVTIRVTCLDDVTSGDYIMEVYSVRGRRVWKTESCCLRRGENILCWDGNSDSGKRSPAGIYLFRIMLGRAFASGKIVLSH